MKKSDVTISFYEDGTIKVTMPQILYITYPRIWDSFQAMNVEFASGIEKAGRSGFLARMQVEKDMIEPNTPREEALAMIKQFNTTLTTE